MPDLLQLRKLQKYHLRQKKKKPTNPLPDRGIPIKPHQLPPRILNILLRLHTHIKDGTIATAANHLTMHAALTALTLGPEASKAHLELADLAQRLGVELAEARAAVLADGAGGLGRARQRLLAAHAGLRLAGELHEAAHGRGGDGDAARVLAREQLPGLLLAQDRLEDAAERLRELVVEVVLGVDGQVVLEHVDWVF